MMPKRLRSWARRVLCTGLLLSSGGDVWSQGTDNVAKGKALYHTHCASCHGKSARGDGWVGQALRTPPTDLTLLARKNGGIFPDATVAEFIDGQRDVLAHGQRSMPVWGGRFLMQEGGAPLDEHMAFGRILALVYYVESLQQK